MATHPSEVLQTADREWVTFPGGELEGQRPKRLCPQCRDKCNREFSPAFGAAAVSSRVRATLCFQCYRLELDREKALKAAGELHTASDARFQFTLPWEPVDVRRLSTLKAARAAERVSVQAGSGRFVDRRRRAQIAARHALQMATAALRARTSDESRAGVLDGLGHAAELQLPESWLPFVVVGR